MTRATRPILIALTCLALALPAAAQNLFAPVAWVNERVVTAFEVDQRARMLELFRSPGDPREEALRSLIDERLQLQEGARLGVTVTAEEVAEGMTEFAGRANLSREEFIAALNGSGVETQSFRDFVRAGLVWRKIVQGLFRQTVNITTEDVNRAVDRAAKPSGVRVLLSEIILPANTPQATARSRPLADELSEIDTLPAFASAARRYSASPSRGRSGRLDWLPIGNLPPAIAQQVLGLQPGEVTAPIQIPNAIALFQLRGLEEEVDPNPEVAELEYAAFYIPGGRSEAALAEARRIAARVDTCNDLYGVAEGLPENRLERDNLPPAEVPTDVALELAQLDDNEVSINLTRANGQTLVFLMLCRRHYVDPAQIDLSAVANSLNQRALQGKADNYLAKLRAEAEIVIQ
ncbi:peptidylprolyl isomerase [Rhodobacteraceae bacterium CCMM004]|nr:peptidylprolyl isomerase [Rhodobacteraceae bacterium CCMM004]